MVLGCFRGVLSDILWDGCQFVGLDVSGPSKAVWEWRQGVLRLEFQPQPEHFQFRCFVCLAINSASVFPVFYSGGGGGLFGALVQRLHLCRVICFQFVSQGGWTVLGFLSCCFLGASFALLVKFPLLFWCPQIALSLFSPNSIDL